MALSRTRRRHVRTATAFMCSVLLPLFGTVALVSLIAVPSAAQPETPRTIRVVMDDNYPPYSFRDASGKLQGILIDEWALWQRRTGIRSLISAMNWDAALNRMRSGEFDVIDTIFQNEERSTWLDFSPPYASLDVPIFFDRNITGIADAQSLRGFAVAAKAGDNAVDVLRRNGVTTLQLFDSYESIVRAAADRRVSVFVIDQQPAFYFLNKFGISSRFHRSAPINVGQFHRAVKRGDRQMLSLVEHGFGLLTPEEIKAIEARWDGESIPESGYLRHLMYAALVALAVLITLVTWNRTLSRVVTRRTAELKKSELRLRAILQTEPAGVLIVDNDLRLIDMNPAGLTMLQAASLQEAQTRSVLSYALTQYHKAFKDLHSNAMQGHPGSMELEIEGARGARRWIAAHLTPLPEETGDSVTVLGMIQDITERKKNEAFTAGRLKVLEMIASSAPVSATLDVLLRAIEAFSPGMLCTILLVSPDGRVRHCAAPSMPGDFIKAIDGALIGPQAGSCGTAAYRRERVFVADIATDPLWANYRDLALSFGLRACWSVPIVTPQNEVLGTFAIYYHSPGMPTEEHLHLIDRATHIATICLNRQHTERALKDSEERFRQVVENIDEVFWMTDAGKTQLLYVSPAYEKTWGRSRANLYSSPEGWLLGIHPDDFERIRQRRLQPQIEERYRDEYRILRADGSMRWIHDSAFPIRNAEGVVYRIAGIAEDITERRALEEQYRQAQKMEAIGTLAAGIAHDFNNILSAINGNTELALQDAQADLPVQRYLNEILQAARRARALVQQILAFTRLQQPEREVLALGPLIEETAGFLRATLPSGVQLAVHIAEDVPPVLANSTQVQQVLLNICTNAWGALEGRVGEIEIDLRAVQVEEDLVRLRPELHVGRYARVTVHDTGKGMDDATCKRIFEPFFTTRAPGQGSGLGLSVAHGIVTSHNGAILVNSELNKGTCVQLFFPAAVAVVEPVTIAAPAPATRGHAQRILYIDDDEALVELTAQILERLGYKPTAFTDARKALEIFRAGPHHFDLAVTDFNMPGLSGLDVAGQLKAIRADLPVVLTSGYIDDSLIERAARVGVQHVLYKPSTIQEFSAALDAILQTSK